MAKIIDVPFALSARPLLGYKDCESRPAAYGFYFPIFTFFFRDLFNTLADDF